jgi:hypothetical protein
MNIIAQATIAIGERQRGHTLRPAEHGARYIVTDPIATAAD